MASHPDEAGPSGLAPEEEEMGDSEEDEICQEVLDRFERQHQFQTELLQEGGGALGEAQGTFDFEVQPYVDRLSSRMGVRERHFKTQLRQRGNFIDGQNIAQALEDGLRRAVNQVLATTPNLHDQDRLYFTFGSNRLHNNFQGWGLRAGEWREGGACLDALFDRLAQALNSNEQFVNGRFLSIVHHPSPSCTSGNRQTTPWQTEPPHVTNLNGQEKLGHPHPK